MLIWGEISIKGYIEYESKGKNNILYYVFKSKKENGWGLKISNAIYLQFHCTKPFNENELKFTSENFHIWAAKEYAQTIEDLINKPKVSPLLEIEIKLNSEPWKSAFGQTEEDVTEWLQQGYLVRMKNI